MISIYIDTDFKCHTAPGEGLTPVETDFFDGECAEYIEGYRFIPSGSTWTRPDGVTFTGEMIAPATDWQTLDDAQAAYEREQYHTLSIENETLTTENAELLEAMAAMVDDVYNQDIGEMEE